MKAMKSITLEMSLKPFKSMEAPDVEAVCQALFSQWRPLLKHADTVKVMLWASDGSEILEYDRNLDKEMEWAKYIGGANPRDKRALKNDPDGVGLHARSYLYMAEPPFLTYRIFRKIVETIKRIGKETLSKKILVGATFDPGPEFAKSPFKYERHAEILRGVSMGPNSFVCCYSVLHADSRSYAGFPDGIPEGTPFGTFFGRQSQLFLQDMGFDYLWLSNGFGFGTETWGTTGAIYDGESFYPEKVKSVKNDILMFWRLFRKECPDMPLETRGTNLTAGIDLSTDGVPLRDIYEGKFGILPPPNSPWAALDGDFGLELTGYMSRIAELPEGDDYLFRFYPHDPWWMNSPWLDRYEGQPHDIYLPLAVSRMNGNGEVINPNHLNLLSIDNSLGDLPDQVANEVMPHLLKATLQQPDAPSPLVWVYPFREYHEAAAADEPDVARPFFQDWFIRGAINQGLPLSTVVSTDNFAASVSRFPELYNGSILVSPVPDRDSEWEAALLGWMAKGNKAVLYGSVRHAGNKLLKALNLTSTSPLDGELDVQNRLSLDELRGGAWPKRILHRPELSDGGIDTVLQDENDGHTEVAAIVGRGSNRRIAALIRRLPEWQGGGLAWVRGTNGNRYEEGRHLLVPDDAAQYFPAESLLRLILTQFGIVVRTVKEEPGTKDPVVMVHRNKGGFYFSGYSPDTTADLKLQFPMGAPLLMGWETRLEEGCSVYRLPRAWEAECRVFVGQEERSLLSCRMIPPAGHDVKRRIQVSGLKDADVVLFPETGFEEDTRVTLNAQPPFVTGEPFDCRLTDTPWGKAFVIHGVTGNLVFATPLPEQPPVEAEKKGGRMQ
ncbi:hypothetical protein [Paenibacillus sp. HB172176]|uniref:hypothetical protein n=1 Tax=Paenibacillus sp. HB172176 TaxID=2493690 RepID=UPI00143A6354|nr:hypothetical protein [Paenibacillus sp. HB172176]